MNTILQLRQNPHSEPKARDAWNTPGLLSTKILFAGIVVKQVRSQPTYAHCAKRFTKGIAP
jgi:hypothetical protein